ncbi:MAG: UDP-N-acetylmuramoyl-L-alanine--D-glutamate ligase [Acidobacteriota bacterium]|nr:UDP-N-acetylmuramoyl-L-alanine--D-glutamate ligase [Acidobacteriota bacterium]
MKPLPSLEGATVVMVGMARSGSAAIRLLREKGASVRAVDEKLTGKLEGIPILPQRAASLEGADLIVISPGVPVDLPLLSEFRARGIAVIGELELASFFLQGDTIGITGSNGKTTTTALTGHILREAGLACQVGGNIGTPPTAMIATSQAGQWNVLELSSFQLETVDTFHARIGAALNVTPDHLDRHHTFEQYAAAKGHLFTTQRPGDYAILNADDPTCVSYAALTPATPVWFSSSRPVDHGLFLEGETIRLDGEPLMQASAIPLRGRHNIENTMAAAAAAHLAGAGLAEIAAAVRTFPGVEHRLELVRQVQGVDYYNDSKATNVDATLKALDAFPAGLWIILGGKDKDSDYTLLRDALGKKARAALLIGAAAEKIAEQIDGAVPWTNCGTLEAAVHCASAQAQPGEVVLLAPACASFDQFENFEHRGRVFKAIVSRIEQRSR